MVKLERNNVGDVMEFSIVVDDYVAMKYANFHKRGLKGSWDKMEKLLFPVKSIGVYT